MQTQCTHQQPCPWAALSRGSSVLRQFRPGVVPSRGSSVCQGQFCLVHCSADIRSRGHCDKTFQHLQPTGSRDNSLLVPETTAYSWWNCQMSSTSANCCQLIPQDRAHTRHYPTVQPMLAATKKETLQAVHTEAVTRAINSQQPNRVLHNRPPPISLEEDTLRRPQRTTLSQLRSGHCRLLNSYQNRLKQTVDPRCPDCGVNPHDVPHLFNCTAHPNALSTVNLWDKPVESIRELSFLDPRNLD